MSDRVVPTTLSDGGSRPIPDPTVLTDQAIAKAMASMRDYIDGEMKARDERLAGIDRATTLRLGEIQRTPSLIDEKVSHLDRVVEVKFAAVAEQFRERDTRSERESRDNKVAVDAAFAAQKEAAAKQDEANAKAIDKSERATSETIKTNQELNQAKTDALTKTLDDVKLTVNGIVSVKQGAKEDRTALYATIGVLITIVLFGVAIIAFVRPA
jgi:ABC-type Na+ efflux pump permease subunit